MTKQIKKRGRPALQYTSNEPQHKGVSVVAPSAKHKRPYWSLRWIKPGETRLDKKGKPKPSFESLPWATCRADAVRHAADKAAKLLGPKSEDKNASRTLKDEFEAYVKAGIKSGKQQGQPYAEPTIRNYAKAVRALTAFAASKGCHMRDDGALYLSEVTRTFDNGRSLLWHWKQHELQRGQCPSAVMALTKCVHAILKEVHVSDTETMFDPRLLAGAIPVRLVAAKQPPRTQTADELRRILQAAMELDTPEELVSADVAMLLLTTFRRNEQSYLKVKHCHIDATPPSFPDHLVTWIELPGKLEDYPQHNHAKGGKMRNVLMTQVSPLGTELLRVLCEGRGKGEWVTSLDYAQLAARVERISTKTGIDFSTKSLRCTAANYNRRVLGKDEAVKRCGHTEGVAKQSYEDETFAVALVPVRPPSLEASMGISAELRDIIKRARMHPRAWGKTERPLPNVLKSGKGVDAPRAEPLQRAG